MKKWALSVLLIGFLFSLGCRTESRQIGIKPPYDNPLPPGQSALRKLNDPYQIPDFTLACFDIKGLKEATDNSLTYLSKPSSKQYYPVQDITHYKAVRSLEAFRELLDSGLSGPALNQAIKEKFDVYISVGCDGQGTVLFTGYYTPIFDGSYQQDDVFRYPLYKQPDDLVKGPNGEILGKRLSDGSVMKYPSRAVIEDTKMLAGNELIWMADPFESYIAHVQGSAKIRLGDGTLQTVGYAANNGYEYQSISQQMISDGVITKKQLSLAAMIDYFKRHKEQVSRYTRLNPRYVFFREESGEPRGSLNVPVIAYRSIATDKSIFPRASLTYVSTTLPKAMGTEVVNELYSGFALDQDTGGAIRAPGRCDVYMGVGDTAGRLAGQTYQEGRLYYLFLKTDNLPFQ
ncbi:MAG: MltA domain-containing protein [Sedimentisphaerales bacterium]|nr:MltA domain-containing protein [Sedimentisphaerales bacterium]